MPNGRKRKKIIVGQGTWSLEVDWVADSEHSVGVTITPVDLHGEKLQHSVVVLNRLGIRDLIADLVSRL